MCKFKVLFEVCVGQIHSNNDERVPFLQNNVLQPTIFTFFKINILITTSSINIVLLNQQRKSHIETTCS